MGFENRIYEFNNYKVKIVVDKLRPFVRITLILADTGEPYMIATSDIPELKMLSNYVAIKNYSENEGVLEFLVVNKIIEKPVTHVKSNYTNFPICKLMV